jgi:hypothetical protein
VAVSFGGVGLLLLLLLTVVVAVALLPGRGLRWAAGVVVVLLAVAALLLVTRFESVPRQPHDVWDITVRHGSLTAIGNPNIIPLAQRSPPDLDAELLQHVIRPAHVQGQDLVVGAHAILPDAEARQAPPPDCQQALRDAVDRAMTAKIAAFLDDAAQHPKSARGAAHIAYLARRLSAQDRREIARRVLAARGPGVISGEQDLGDQMLRQIRIPLDDVLAAFPTRAGHAVAPRAALGTLGVILAAVVVLKLATRRHLARQPHHPRWG